MGITDADGQASLAPDDQGDGMDQGLSVPMRMIGLPSSDDEECPWAYFVGMEEESGMAPGVQAAGMVAIQGVDSNGGGYQAITFHPMSDKARAHLKPLYVQAYIDGKKLDRVFVDGGAVFNVMPLRTLKKLGRTTEDIVSAEIEMASFTGQSIVPMGYVVAQVDVGEKTVCSVFFIIDMKTSYTALLGRDWIHSAQCVPSTLHQKLMFWEGDKILTVDAAPDPFRNVTGACEAMLYAPNIPPISLTSAVKDPWLGCKLTSQGYSFY